MDRRKFLKTIPLSAVILLPTPYGKILATSGLFPKPDSLPSTNRWGGHGWAVRLPGAPGNGLSATCIALGYYESSPNLQKPIQSAAVAELGKSDPPGKHLSRIGWLPEIDRSAGWELVGEVDPILIVAANARDRASMLFARSLCSEHCHAHLLTVLLLTHLHSSVLPSAELQQEPATINCLDTVVGKGWCTLEMPSFAPATDIVRIADTLITRNPGLPFGIDFQDILTTLVPGTTGVTGWGQAHGKNRMRAATKEAFQKIKLLGADPALASGFIIGVQSDRDTKLREMQVVLNTVRQSAHNKASIVFVPLYKGEPRDSAVDVCVIASFAPRESD